MSSDAPRVLAFDSLSEATVVDDATVVATGPSRLDTTGVDTTIEDATVVDARVRDGVVLRATVAGGPDLRRFLRDGDRVTFGSGLGDSTPDFVVDGLQPMHASVELRGSVLWLVAHAQLFVDGEAVVGSVPIEDNTAVSVGPVRMRLERHAVGAPAKVGEVVIPPDNSAADEDDAAGEANAAQTTPPPANAAASPANAGRPPTIDLGKRDLIAERFVLPPRQQAGVAHAAGPALFDIKLGPLRLSLWLALLAAATAGLVWATSSEPPGAQAEVVAPFDTDEAQAADAGADNAAGPSSSSGTPGTPAQVNEAVQLLVDRDYRGALERYRILASGPDAELYRPFVDLLAAKLASLCQSDSPPGNGQCD